ncbi:MAG TPA: sigma-54 dependent transcriptional regulator [Terriglobia bacterium]|nr:sigma-54 dependent transcriptional regulator [Terriglobia bacterium]
MNTLVASPNSDFRRHMAEALQASSWPVEEAVGGAEALAKLEQNDCHVLLLDQSLPDLDVTEIVGLVREQYPDLAVYVVDPASPVPLISEEPEGRSHRAAILSLLKSLQPANVVPAGVVRSQPSPPARPGTPSPTAPEPAPASVPVQAAVPMPAYRPVPAPAPAATSVPVSVPAPAQVVKEKEAEPLPGMIGSSPAMQEVYRLVRLVSPRNTTVLITGDTGTGKELVARAIHLVSPRMRQPFITVNCAAIPEALLESELFGYARGAFTGAFQSKVGRIHSAHGGTLFLDEVGDLPLSMQAKLLRFLQEGEVQRLGSSDVVRVDVRVIAATNADLTDRVRDKTFREDLYYRLSVFPIELQTLRERADDIILLSMHFLRGFCQEASVPEKRISPAAQEVLKQHPWPGNIRELRHVIERAFILSEQGREILPEHITLRKRPRPG